MAPSIYISLLINHLTFTLYTFMFHASNLLLAIACVHALPDANPWKCIKYIYHLLFFHFSFFSSFLFSCFKGQRRPYRSLQISRASTPWPTLNLPISVCTYFYILFSFFSFLFFLADPRVVPAVCISLKIHPSYQLVFYRYTLDDIWHIRHMQLYNTTVLLSFLS